MAGVTLVSVPASTAAAAALGSGEAEMQSSAPVLRAAAAFSGASVIAFDIERCEGVSVRSVQAGSAFLWLPPSSSSSSFPVVAESFQPD